MLSPPYWIFAENFPKAGRIGKSFLVLLGCPSGRYYLGTTLLPSRRHIETREDPGDEVGPLPSDFVSRRGATLKSRVFGFLGRFILLIKNAAHPLSSMQVLTCDWLQTSTMSIKREKLTKKALAAILKYTKH